VGLSFSEQVEKIACRFSGTPANDEQETAKRRKEMNQFIRRPGASIRRY
jgi:hypothetical protein